MKKIINPWKGLEGYNCFGCAPNNEAGIKMEFYEDGDEVVSIWKPRPEYQGWINTLHGGIQAVLMDEICAWVILRKLQTTGVTSKMETRYRKPVSTTDSHIVLRASIKEVTRGPMPSRPGPLGRPSSSARAGAEGCPLPVLPPAKASPSVYPRHPMLPRCRAVSLGSGASPWPLGASGSVR